MLDAYWQRTAAILAQKADEADADVEQEAEDNQQSGHLGKSPAAQALAAAQCEAIAGPGRLVALQVSRSSFYSQTLCCFRAKKSSTRAGASWATVDLSLACCRRACRSG